MSSDIAYELVYDELEGICGRNNISTSECDKEAHSLNAAWYTRTMWYGGEPTPKPDIIVYPENTKQVSEILEVANREKVPVTPFGGGSSGMGGNIPVQGGVVVDMKKMNDLVEVNDKSLMATVQTGIGCFEYEDELNRIGFTSGHLPASHYCSTIGGYLALRSAGRLSTGYGKIEDMVLGLEVVLPNGKIVKTRAVPAHATGPDLDQLFVGSEGTLGIITKATLKIHPYPEKRRFRGILFPNLHSGIEGLRKIMRNGLTPSVGRVYSEEETATLVKENWGMDKKGSYLVIGFDGSEELVSMMENKALEICKEENGEDLGREVGEEWWENRYKDYYPSGKESSEMWHALMGGFGAGGTVDACLPYDKVETAYKEIQEEFMDKFSNNYEAWIYAHFSHWYKSGTMFYARWHLRDIPEDTNKMKLYNRVWRTLIPIVLKYDGVIEHHHGCGRILGRFLKDQDKGGFEVLKKIKKAIDPKNIMNPGNMGLGDY